MYGGRSLSWAIQFVAKNAAATTRDARHERDERLPRRMPQQQQPDEGQQRERGQLVGRGERGGQAGHAESIASAARRRPRFAPAR